jgi:hypothetical protein
MSASKAVYEALAAASKFDKAVEEILVAIALLPRGVAQARLITRVTEDMGVSRERVDAAIFAARPNWPSQTWAAEARYLKKRINVLTSTGGHNGEIARCRLALKEAIAHST